MSIIFKELKIEHDNIVKMGTYWKDNPTNINYFAINNQDVSYSHYLGKHECNIIGKSIDLLEYLDKSLHRKAGKIKSSFFMKHNLMSIFDLIDVEKALNV
jgi:hypothetical protein